VRAESRREEVGGDRGGRGDGKAAKGGGTTKRSLATMSALPLSLPSRKKNNLKVFPQRSTPTAPSLLLDKHNSRKTAGIPSRRPTGAMSCSLWRHRKNKGKLLKSLQVK
jgi:hypothetical protein